MKLDHDHAGQAKLVLASTSRYRRELLSRLHIPFEVLAPDVDETPLPGETPSATALRLSVLKARAAASTYPDALIVGSDQVLMLDSEQLGKPGDFDKAFAQLQQYAVALENPPLLIVSDMETIRLHTNFTNTVQEIHTIPIEELADAAGLAIGWQLARRFATT